MTFRDMLCLIRRYWYIAVIVPVVCALACGVYLRSHTPADSYVADSYIIVGAGGEQSTIYGAAVSASRECNSNNPGYVASVKSDVQTLTITVTVGGPEGEKCEKLSSDIVDKSIESAKSLLAKDKISAKIEKGKASLVPASTSPTSYIAIAFLVGLFIAVCVITAINAIRRPVKSAADLAIATELPLLGQLPKDGAERVLANVNFAVGEADAVCIVPASGKSPADAVASLLTDESKKENAASTGQTTDQTTGQTTNQTTTTPVAFDVMPALSSGMKAAYAARSAAATVVVAAMWVDSLRDVEATVAELRFAGANVVGCVCAHKLARKE